MAYTKQKHFDWDDLPIYLFIGAVVLVIGGGIWYASLPQRTAEGNVAQKVYTPPYVEVIPAKSNESCSGSGARRVCTTHYEPARIVNHNETFQIQIVESGCADIYSWRYVSKDEYAKIKEGDPMTFKTVWARCNPTK